MSVLDETLRKHRQRIIAREEATFRELLAIYAEFEKDFKREIAQLQKKIKAAKDAGQTISPSWLYRERRLKTFLDTVKTQIERFGGRAAAITTREQREAIQIAVEQTAETLSVVGGGRSAVGSLFNPRVVEDSVGMMGDGSPILEYYREQLAPKVVELIRSEVIKAAATGTDFKTIARRLVQTGQITRSRALTVARTEVNRVRRETTRQIYQDNSDVISGWEWATSKSSRTCPACLAMDGRIFKLEDAFPQHINCRCTMIPVVGVPRPSRTIGSDWFDSQDEVTRTRILGKDAAAAYGRGEITLNDLVGWKNHKQFGKSVYVKKLSDAIAGK